MSKTFIAKYKPEAVITGQGSIVVVTGWTVKDAVAKRLDVSEYAAIGQLFSPVRGISLLIRNLLANLDIVAGLVVMHGTRQDENAGSGRCLLDFLDKGVRRGKTDLGRPAWVINSDVAGYIDQEIPMEFLDQVRALPALSVTSLDQAVTTVRTMAVTQWPDHGFRPIEFPLPPTEEHQLLPGPLYGHRIEGPTIADVWVKIIHRIYTTGIKRPTATHGGQWQELIDLTAIVTDEPDDFYFPEPNYLPISREFIGEYVSQILDDAPVAEGVKYTYGQRLRSWFGCDQIQQVIDKAIVEPDAASLVMSLWDPADHTKGGSPCLNHIWVRIVDGVLSLTALFRSNDMFSAWPANAMGLRALQMHICNEVNRLRSGAPLRLGPLITISQSAHIYDDCWENARELFRKYYYGKRIDYDDAVGNFVISIDGNRILAVERTTVTGEIVACYSGTDPLKLTREIIADSPAIDPTHAAYLGLELGKAALAIQLGKPYTQDRHL